MAGKDISRLLQQRVLETLTDAEKWEINEKQLKEILSMNPGYAAEYFTRSFTAKQQLKQDWNDWMGKYD